MEETILPSIAELTPEARERWRQKRDSILDQLEEEERREQVREQHRNFEQKEEALRRVEEEAAKEKLRLQSAKEIQKKMGRALVRNLAKANEEASEPPEIQLGEDEKSPKAFRPKKAVTFTEPDDDKSTLSSPSKDWGDVAPGRLRLKGPTLITRQQPMKDVVVERVPKARFQTDHLPDSDDESDYGDDGQINEVHGLHDEETDSDIDGDSVSEDLEQEEYDLDSVQHHREIALEYYAKRNKIGEAARTAMSSHSHVKDRDVELVRAISLPNKSVFDFSMSRISTCRSPLNTDPLCPNLKLVVWHLPITLLQNLLVLRSPLQLLLGKYRKRFELVD